MTIELNATIQIHEIEEQPTETVALNTTVQNIQIIEQPEEQTITLEQQLSGTRVTYTAGETINAPCGITIGDDGLAYKFSSANSDHNLVGITNTGAITGQEINVIQTGILSSPNFGFEAGMSYFINGTQLSTVPPSEGTIQYVGVGLDEDHLIVIVLTPVRLA